MLVAGVGLLNALLMTVLERQKEIGVLLALGLSRMRVVSAILIEAAIIGFIGTAIGLVAGLIGSRYLVTTGIDLGEDAFSGMAFALDSIVYGVLTTTGVVRAGVLGLVVAIVGALWPALKASGVRPVEAMRK